ncbi:MAG: DUF1844 domain-containing protein [Desulfomonilaceae bacterium]
MQEPENETGFVIRDKRHSSFDEKKEESQVKDPSQANSTQQPPSASDSTKPEGEPKSTPAPVDFISFILGMAQTALFQLGLIQIQGGEQTRKDLIGARQTIDIIAMIEEKTRGNLTDDEKKVIKDTLFQLRMAFVEMSK